MGFWSFMRDMLLFDWLFGDHKEKASNNQTNKFISQNQANDNDLDFIPPSSSNYFRSSWDDGHYASDDYYHDSQDDYAHNFDDFDDDF